MVFEIGEYVFKKMLRYSTLGLAFSFSEKLVSQDAEEVLIVTALATPPFGRHL